MALEEVKEDHSVILVLYVIPETIHHFDSESLWTPTDYLELMTTLIRIARGQFSPTNLTINPGPEEEQHLVWDRDLTFTLSFELKGHRYSHIIRFKGDYVDARFIDTFNLALREQGHPGQYYWVDTNDQCIELIFLTEPQYELLREVSGFDLKKWREIYVDPKDFEKNGGRIG